MNDPITTLDQETVKPCRKCGGLDRYKSGRCKVCHKASAQASYQKHKNKRLASNKLWIASNSEKHKQLCANWRDKNKAAHRDMIKQWELNNPDKVKEKSIRSCNARRARSAGNGGKLSKDIVQKLLKRQNGKCACCGLSLSNGYHLDHIIPLALGGKNSDDNVQLLTPKCNLKKGAKHPIDYMQSKGLLL